MRVFERVVAQTEKLGNVLNGWRMRVSTRNNKYKKRKEKKNILVSFLPVATVWGKKKKKNPPAKRIICYDSGGKKMLKDFVSCSCTPDFMLMNLRCRLLCKHYLTEFSERGGFDI